MKHNVREPTDEMFITCLYSLAENWTYGNLRDEMIRDHIAMGNCDSVLSEQL